MKFEYEPFHRNTPDEVLLDDLRRVAEMEGQSPTSKKYTALGKFRAMTIINRFGSWEAALNKMGLEPRYYQNFSNADLFEDLKNVIDKLHGNITAKSYDQHGKYSSGAVINRFGSWNMGLDNAGLSSEIKKIKRLEREEELFENLESVWLHIGHQPRIIDMHSLPSKFSGKVYLNVFGSWSKALESFVAKANEGSIEESKEKNDDSLQFLDKNQNHQQQLAPKTQKPIQVKRSNRDPNLRLRW
jgi:hypothetical protein